MSNFKHTGGPLSSLWNWGRDYGCDPQAALQAQAAFFATELAPAQHIEGQTANGLMHHQTCGSGRVIGENSSVSHWIWNPLGQTEMGLKFSTGVITLVRLKKGGGGESMISAHNISTKEDGERTIVKCQFCQSIPKDFLADSHSRVWNTSCARASFNKILVWFGAASAHSMGARFFWHLSFYWIGPDSSN